MKVLFIGGTGVISSACSEECLRLGHELYLLNRGKSLRPPATGARLIRADISDMDGVNRALQSLRFDLIVDWIAYEPSHIKRDFALFKDKTDQYVFISSASAYQKPPRVPVRESDPIGNPYWTYSQNKALCEQALDELYRKEGFPITIVRPSHTYDRTKIPLHGGFTTLYRLLSHKKVIIHGDGTSLWTLTHHRDFARGFCALLGRTEAIGQAFHITSDEALTWDEICHTMARAANVEAQIIHLPSDFIARYDREWGEGLLGDKAWTFVPDNSKIKELVPSFQSTIPFKQGATEIVDWYLADPARQVVNRELDRRMDEMIERYESVLP